MNDIYLKSEYGFLYLSKNKIGENKNTNFDTYGDGATIYLDRHNVDCGNRAINNFRLVNDRTQGFRYEYSCSKEQLTDIEEKYTNYDLEGVDKELYKSYYLDRHNVDCGNKSLVQFNLKRDGLGNHRYNYKCGSSNVDKCRDLITSTQTAGGGHIAFLDRHNIKCNEDEYLSQFRYRRPLSDDIYYEYKCCSKNNDTIIISNTGKYSTTYNNIKDDFITISPLPLQRDRIFIYEKNSNKLLHITDYIPKGVKSNIKIDYNNNGEIISTIIYDKIIVENENIVITSLTSSNGRYTAKQNPDGLLVITDRDKDNKVIWDSSLYGNIKRCITNCTYTLVFQSDGNLVTFSDKNNIGGNIVTWAASNTNKFNSIIPREGPYTLIMRDDGYLTIYNKNSQILWIVRYDEVIVYDEDIVIKELTSENGRYTAKQNPDGLLVITDRDKGNKVIWDSLYSVNYIKNQEPYNGMSTCTPNCTYTLVLQPDGNLVTYSDKKNMFDNNYVWAISSSVRLYDDNNRKVGKPYTLIMRDDGNLVLYNKDFGAYWSILSNHNKLYNSLIDTNLYIKWEFTELIEFENFSNENGKISFTVSLNKTNRMFIYDKISNKLLHITDYISKGVKSNIIIYYNNGMISSSVNYVNKLPVPNFSIDKDRFSESIGGGGGKPTNFECSEGSIINRVHTEANGQSYIEGIYSSCINPYSGNITNATEYHGDHGKYPVNCENQRGFSRMYAIGKGYVDQLSFDGCANGWYVNYEGSKDTNFECKNGKISRLDIRTGGNLDLIKAYCSYPTIK